MYETRPRETPFVCRYTVVNAEQSDGLPARALDWGTRRGMRAG